MNLTIVSDINKFLWMVRIGGSTDRGAHIKETDYYSPSGEFRIDKDGSPTMLNSLMYKMCYYRFGSVYTEAGRCLLACYCCTSYRFTLSNGICLTFESNQVKTVLVSY